MGEERVNKTRYEPLIPSTFVLPILHTLGYELIRETAQYCTLPVRQLLY